MNNKDIEILEDIKTEEELYKYIIKRMPNKLPLEHEIFAIRNHDFHNLDYAIYVDGYISIDAIVKNIKKQQTIQNLLKENQANKEKIKGMVDNNAKLIEVTNLYLDSIPKSKLREKIEELESYLYKGNITNDFLMIRIKAKIEILEELLHEE